MKKRAARITLGFLAVMLVVILPACTQSSSFQVFNFPTATASLTLPAKDLASIMQFYGTATAQAKQTLASVPATPTPLPSGTTVANTTLIPPPTSTATLAPVVDLRHKPIIGPIILHFENLGNNPFLVAILASLLTLMVAFLKTIVGWGEKAWAWLWARLHMRGADYEFEKQYLDWIISQHRHLGILPAQVVVRRWGERQHLVDLEDIFVRLAVSTQSVDTLEPDAASAFSWLKVSWYVRFSRVFLHRLMHLFEIQEIKIRGKRVIDSWYLTAPEIDLNEPSLIIERNKRVVFRGDPGSGKTTLMRYLAVTCARSLRNDLKDGDRRHLVRERLFWTKSPFPILIKLSKYSNVLDWGSERGLLDAFTDEMPLELRKQCPSDFFERRLKERPCLILLDAFDELGSPAVRAEMARRIDGFLEFFDKPMHRIVVTTRIVGYEGQLNRYGFQIRTVQPLQDGDVRALIKLRYKAIGVSESVGRNSVESQSIQSRVLDRARSLIARVETTPQLRQLSENPMLLSLIVLVHFLKVELPDERVLLYRDCVEILTERWQQYKWEEAGLMPQVSSNEVLTLTQKLVLLRELAYAMQKTKNEKNSEALIRQEDAIAVIARTLPDLIAIQSSGKKNQKQAEYRRYAEGWVKGIQETSGILVEQGLAQDGEPLIGFSHLTFQEYLTAVALHEVPEYEADLWSNLLNPSWRETILLYVVITNDATSVIKKLVESDVQPDATLLAGDCLAEKVRKVNARVQASTYTKLKKLFIDRDTELVVKAGSILGRLLTSNIIQFLIERLESRSWQVVMVAIRALGNLKTDDKMIEDARSALLSLLNRETPVEVKVIARESLARIGDPRFIDINPPLVDIPDQLFASVIPFKNPFRYLHLDIMGKNAVTIARKVGRIQVNELIVNLYRNLDLAFYILSRKMLRYQNFTDAFSISKYPITNLEYKRFVDETGYDAPDNWQEGTFPLEKSTYPVTRVWVTDAHYYCRWLSEKTGYSYRIPSEWEWEIAAGGPKFLRYPWSEEWSKKVHPELAADPFENEMETTLPVGTYGDEGSFGIQDMARSVEQPVFVATLKNILASLVMGSVLWLMVVLIQWFIEVVLSFRFSIDDAVYLLQQLFLLGPAKAIALLPGGANRIFFLMMIFALTVSLLTVLLLVWAIIKGVAGIPKLLHSYPDTDHIDNSNESRSYYYHGGSRIKDSKYAITYYRSINNYRMRGFRLVRNKTSGKSSL